jgi:hypothetical protein
MSDYIFFGEAFRWSPESIDRFPWSMRKELKEIWTDIVKQRAEELKKLNR